MHVEQGSRVITVMVLLITNINVRGQLVGLCGAYSGCVLVAGTCNPSFSGVSRYPIIYMLPV